MCVCARADVHAGARVCFCCTALPAAPCEATATAKICDQPESRISMETEARVTKGSRDTGVEHVGVCAASVGLNLVPDI